MYLLNKDMGQNMCGGVREEPKRTLDLGIFDNSKHFCTMRKGSPYYKKKIKKAERRVLSAKLLYDDYREKKQERKESKICRSKRRIRSNSN